MSLEKDHHDTEQCINKEKQKLGNKQKTTSPLVKITHKIMSCHITFGHHIISDRSNGTENSLIKITIKITDLIIVTAPGCRVKITDINRIIDQITHSGTEDNLSVVVDDPEYRRGITGSQHKIVSDGFNIGRRNIIFNQIVLRNVMC